MKFRVIIYLLVSIALSSCFQEDEPVPPYQSPPGVTSNVVNMGPLYGTQWFYDLATDSFVSIVNRDSWDLAFQCGEDEFHIYTNLAKRMSVANTGLTDFNAVTSSTGLTFRFDRSEGFIDSTAFGEWGLPSGNVVNSFNYVYVVDRGITTLGVNIGKKKVQVIALSGGNYQMRFANLDGSNEHWVNVAKNDNYNFMHLSFDGSGSVLAAQPPKADWDLVFTQYTTKVTQEATQITEDYSVNGVLINPFMVAVAHEFVKPFTEINYLDLNTYAYSGNWDAIGYDWKYYDFDAMMYVIEPGRTYIIKSTEGDYYKMRFTSFVNDLGEKGHPTFEVSKF